MDATGQQLQEEFGVLGEFVDLLEKEQQVLLGVSVDELPALATRKGEMAARIVRLSQKRRQSYKVSEANPDTEETLRRAAPDALPLWRKVRNMALRAQQLNQTNGVLIQVRMSHNQKALAVLCNASGAVMYGSDGRFPGSLTNSNSSVAIKA
jgi:flagella synthesis protein FlgN